MTNDHSLPGGHDEKGAAAGQVAGEPVGTESASAMGAALRAAVPRGDLGFLMDVEVRVSVELGRCKMRIEDLLQLGPGGVIRLEKQSDEPLDVRINDRLIARGDAVVLGEKFGVRLVEVVERPDRA